MIGRRLASATGRQKCLQKAEIEKIPCVIGVQHGIAAEDVIFKNARKPPRHAAIGGVAVAGLPEVGGYAVKLPPTDDHPVGICGVHANGRLVRSVAENIVTARIDIHLVTRERTVVRDHSRRSLYSENDCGGGVVVVFARLYPAAPRRERLSPNREKRN